MNLLASSNERVIFLTTGFIRIPCVAKFSRYKFICLVTFSNSLSRLVVAVANTPLTWGPFIKCAFVKTSVEPVVDPTAFLHWSIYSEIGPRRHVDVCSMKSLHAERRQSSKSRLESTDDSCTDTPSRSNVIRAFSVLMENNRRLRFARKRVTALPASLKSSCLSTDLSWISNGESCSRRISKCFTRNKSAWIWPLLLRMNTLPSLRLFVQDCTDCNAISSNTRGSTTRKIFDRMRNTERMGGNHDS